MLPETTSSKDSDSYSSRKIFFGILASMVLVGILLAILIYFDVHLKLVALLEWTSEQGALAALLFILLMAAVVIFLLPGIFFTAGAGYVFGIVEGTLYVVIGSTLGAGIAFLAARYLFGKRARKFIKEHNKLTMVDDTMAKHSFHVVLLTRLIPFFPGKLSNYFFGLSKFNFRGYILGTFIGFIPFSLHNVYLGSLASNLTSLMDGDLARNPVQWVFYGLGFLATIVALVYFNKLARQALSNYNNDNYQQVTKS